MTRREPASLSAAKYLDPMGLPLRLIRRDPERECSLHRHEFSELVVVYGGGGTHLAFGGAHRLSPGDVFLIGAPGPPHGFINTRDLALYNLLFDRKKLSESLQSQAYPVFAELSGLELAADGGTPLHLTPGELSRVLEILRGIECEQHNARSYSALAMTSHFILLLVELARICRGRERRPEARSFCDRRGEERLAELLMALAEHPEQELKRGEMAKRLCVSESTLQRLFRTRTGYSPHDYLMQLRLKKAATLLLESELSVAEIAAETGFSDSNYFCRRFRLFAKCSPRDFRRRNRR